MSHAPQPMYKHSDALSKLNDLVIDIKLHLLEVKIQPKEAFLEKIDRMADDIREDIERCKDSGIRY